MPKVRLCESLTAEQVRNTLSYDPDTGIFTRQDRNTGKPMGYLSNGYIRITIYYSQFLAHRLAWVLMTGEWPSHEIDHIDGNRSNNVWSNLRSATHSENQKNLPKHAKKIGLKGAHWHKASKKWIGRIMSDGVTYNLGLFDTPEAAHAAYVEAATRLHGDFARFA